MMSVFISLSGMAPLILKFWKITTAGKKTFKEDENRNRK